ncbi:hypothetical protein RHMOL_Rhmol10G0090200 [Rhododendron molle]|uniref:Uncharacterized protein n=1 Tax=Rhododendron molle TaxID=49168 RepID=A0ACC0M269_RHOML|nr:hypothetical protein RHMOL_Rhmol10G0090200 [Rhododendron molle]
MLTKRWLRVSSAPPSINKTEVIDSGFGLRWDADDTNCNGCVQSGGVCGSGSGYEFASLCSDQAYPVACNSTRGGSGKKKRKSLSPQKLMYARTLMASEGNPESTPLVTNLDGDDEENGNPTAKRSRKLRSRAWKHFEKLTAKPDEIKAKCLQCKAILSGASANGTSHLLRHITTCRKRLNSDIRQFMLSNETALDGTSTLKNYKFDQDVVRREIGLMVVLDERPFTTAEDLVPDWFNGLNADAVRPNSPIFFIDFLLVIQLVPGWFNRLNICSFLRK